VKYSLATPAGKLSFDNAAARHIVKALSNGPCRLSEIANAPIPEQDILANALVLSAALVIWPVDGGTVSVEHINQAMSGRLPFHALPCGTAIRC
jgi:hypothetical protein